jgi:hypothetical protein
MQSETKTLERLEGAGRWLLAISLDFNRYQYNNFPNFTSNGFLNSILPILLFCILFGRPMDFEVSAPSAEYLRDGIGDNHPRVSPILGFE